MPVTLNHNEEMLDPNTFAVHARMATSEWAYKIQIKDQFDEKRGNDPVLIAALCNSLVAQLDRIGKNVGIRKDLKKDEGEYYERNVNDLRDQFESLAEDEDRCDQYFNYILDNLYDLGDTKMELKDGRLQKFLWIG